MALKHNLVANYAGNAWTGLMSVVFVPVYLRYIGAEGYGLVGFFSMISAVLTILDGGFGAAASRELSKRHSESEASELNDLIRSLEYGFWLLALMLGVGLVLLAPVITHEWLHVQFMDKIAASNAVRLMGVALILQWPTAYYRGCIIGLQQQIGLNAISAFMATAKGVGSVLTLWLLSPTVDAFFAWQIAVAFLNVYALRRYLWRHMPRTVTRPRFSRSSVLKVGHFAAGVGASNVLALVLTQLDKILLSKILPLSQFGYYALAATLSGLIYQFIGPVFNAFYPRITHAVAHEQTESVSSIYQLACQTMGLSVVPIAMLMVFFGRDMVWVWTGNTDLAHDIQWVVACLATGTMFNGLMTIPYALQLANGWTSLAFWQNAVAVSVLGPLIYFFATRFGLIGAAGVWPMLNFGYVMIAAPLMYRRLLTRDMGHWYLYSIAVPIATCAIVLLGGKSLLDAMAQPFAKYSLVAAVAAVFIISLVASAVAMPELRRRALSRLKAA